MDDIPGPAVGRSRALEVSEGGRAVWQSPKDHHFALAPSPRSAGQQIRKLRLTPGARPDKEFPTLTHGAVRTYGVQPPSGDTGRFPRSVPYASRGRCPAPPSLSKIVARMTEGRLPRFGARKDGPLTSARASYSRRAFLGHARALVAGVFVVGAVLVAMGITPLGGVSQALVAFLGIAVMGSHSQSFDL